MSVPVPDLPERLIPEYRERLARTTHGTSRPGVDEVLRGLDGTGDTYTALAETVESLGLAGLLAARAEARRLVEDDGVTYGVGSYGRPGRGWVIDPLPLILDPGQWQALETGMQQRAHLLDLILTDLYTERRLLRSRSIPAQIVLGHAGFLPSVDGIRLPGPRQLILTACDLARDSGGTWRVIADRTQVPSGSGYAMANRRITSRVMAGLHRRTPLLRLRSWFDEVTAALVGIAPEGVDLPRVAIFSPGAESETAYEMSFLSTLLGFPVVESEDLTTRRGRVSIRGGDRIEKVDVLLRRVDADFSDPLDLRSDSRLGVTGLVEAARLGNLSVANPLGSAVLENPALLPYLEPLARELLGESLLLDHAPTWWCGQEQGRRHVLANLDSLIIKPIARAEGPVRFGWQLSSAEREEMRARIEARPWAWVGQEQLDASTTPVVTRSGLEGRRVLLRSFAVASETDYQVLPGGLARVAAFTGQDLISNMSGALAKDVWVLARPGVERPLISLGTRRGRLLPERVPAGLAARVADNLFWMGRYAERAEATARLLRVADDLAEDHAARPGTPGAAAMDAMVATVSTLSGNARGERPVLDYLRGMLLDPADTGTVAWAVTRLIGATYEVRDQLSLDTWSVLGRLERTLAAIPGDETQLQPQIGRLLESLLAVSGISAESMVRDATWGLLESGVRIERAVHTLGLLRLSVAAPQAPVVEGQVAESVLAACESIITHRRRTASGAGPALPAESAVALLLLDPGNPRSVLFQLSKLAEALTLVEDPEGQAVAEALAADLGAVDATTLFEDERAPLRDLLWGLEDRLRVLSDDLSGRHFTRPAPQRSLPLAWSSAREVAQ